MYKRIALVAVLIATLGLAGTASAAPTASNERAGALAETATVTATFHGWTSRSYEGTAAVDGLRPDATAVQPVVVQGFARIESAALIDKTVEVQLFSGTSDGTTCGGTPVATLSAANMADSGWIARSAPPGDEPSLLGQNGAQCAIITGVA